MSNFTEGEWSVSIQGVDKGLRAVIVKLPGGGFDIAGIPNAENNAYLIAAAPDMYKMIKELSHELNIAIDEINEYRAKGITSSTENEPDYIDKQTVHESQVLLAKARRMYNGY
ncbi:MAG: hypothetical protein Unbinned5350contig1004_29 [Prokaryotic dsDNA virus sp.]|nr:MAG: hypothetical protein Unbinned5350contig1004_29 [Prokaryotic dsDNA virus sp.]|tara:strand:+ start:1684 stop:2022 length:339 start_codon:yes stop_codon:yes gene_type:complete